MKVEVDDFEFMGMKGRLVLSKGCGYFSTLCYDPTKDFRHANLTVYIDKEGQTKFSTSDEPSPFNGLISIYQIPDNISPYLIVGL